MTHKAPGTRLDAYMRLFPAADLEYICSGTEEQNTKEWC